MILKTLQYSEYESREQEWTLHDLILGKSNLIVGKNASGKSRIVNVIFGLASHLNQNRRPVLSGSYDVVFDDEGRTLRYELKFDEALVVYERFSIDGETLLDRGAGGEGKIFAKEIEGGSSMRFQTPPTELAAVARRDAIQHPFLEPLHSWGRSVRLYRFGSALGKEHLLILKEDPPSAKEDADSDPDRVVSLFRRAEIEFGPKFEEAVRRDMEAVGYEVERIGIGPLVSVRLSDPPGRVVGLYVKEKSLRGLTDQHSMSQGMFRALSLFVHINYSQLRQTATCVMIDDIGEGLDFDRSCRVIDAIREKVKHQPIQLILTTNDRFVMNQVPLEEWSVLQRAGNHVYVRNYANSKDTFEDFRFTGLSNFSFLEMDVLNDPKTRIQ